MSFRCETCNYTTDRKFLYDRHKKNKNGCKKKTVCKYCPRIFTSDVTCQKHQKKCPNKKKRICKYCGKQFTRVSSLHLHFKTCKKKNDNLDQTPCQVYLCPFCHDNFNKTDEFKTHIEICPRKESSSPVKTINNTTQILTIVQTSTIVPR